MNQVQLIGRLTKDIDLRDVRGAKKVGSFTIAVNRRDKDREPDFIRCKVWNVQAEVMAKYVKKGHRVGITGRIETGKYEHEGRTIYTTEVVVENFEFLEPKKEMAAESAPEWEPAQNNFVEVPDFPDLPY